MPVNKRIGTQQFHMVHLKLQDAWSFPSEFKMFRPDPQYNFFPAICGQAIVG